MKKQKISALELCQIAIFTALTAILAQIAIPLPFTPMPISFGMVAIYAAGMLLTPRCAVLSQLCYLLLGGIGIPVFANFGAGPGVLFGPRGGYLFAYPLMALLVSVALNAPSRRSTLEGARLYVSAALALLGAITIEYLSGVVWFSLTTGTGFAAALAIAVYPFIPLDLFKIAFSVIGILPIRGRMYKAVWGWN